MFNEKFITLVIDAVKNTVKQGNQSFCFEEDVCAYRANGLKCVVGWMIPDELYNEEMEGAQVAFQSSVQDALAEVLGRPLEQTEMNFLMCIQRAHDDFNRDQNPKELFVSEFLKRIDDLRHIYPADVIDRILKEAGHEHA